MSSMIDKTEASVKSIVRAQDIHKNYKIGKNNFVHALRGASLDVNEGEMTAIIGSSGSGKSTLLHIMGVLDRPDKGEVWLSGERVDNLPKSKLTKLRASELGFIFQGYNLVSTLTAMENVALAAEYAGRSRREALKMAETKLSDVGLADRMRHLPTELSGGQQQRVAIARSLINNPKVVLGDEPTGNLDTATSNEIIKMMGEINKTTGTTFILVTHDLEVAEMCDRIIHMKDGEVLDEAESPASTLS